MTLYRVALRLAFDSTFPLPRKWSTTFFVEAANAVAAASVGALGWEGPLRQAAKSFVFCYDVYATDLNPGTTDYANVAPALSLQRGAVAPATAELYLDKFCAAVTITVPLSRPSRKFWRYGFEEAEVSQAGRTISPAVITLIRDAWNDFIDINPGLLRDEDGQAYTQVANVRATTREFGRESTNLVPQGPPLG